MSSQQKYMNDLHGYVYITAYKTNTVLYVGVTDRLVKRIWQHKMKFVDGFNKKYNVNKLVYYEIYDQMTEAIFREKQLKGGSRQKKIDLITKMNPSFPDLYDDIV
jgi:putative endonuclease